MEVQDLVCTICGGSLEGHTERKCLEAIKIERDELLHTLEVLTAYLGKGVKSVRGIIKWAKKHERWKELEREKVSSPKK